MSPVPGAVAFVLALLVAFGAIGWLVEIIRARRNEQQLRDEICLRRAMKLAGRFGLIPEDVQ